LLGNCAVLIVVSKKLILQGRLNDCQGTWLCKQLKGYFCMWNVLTLFISCTAEYQSNNKIVNYYIMNALNVGGVVYQVDLKIGLVT